MATLEADTAAQGPPAAVLSAAIVWNVGEAGKGEETGTEQGVVEEPGPHLEKQVFSPLSGEDQLPPPDGPGTDYAALFPT
ncbi:hypothetical protein CB1_000232002 [Camelus ferus]|nr:hypothetical protein CB1_000232002 [Camelus ferus]